MPIPEYLKHPDREAADKLHLILYAPRGVIDADGCKSATSVAVYNEDEAARTFAHAPRRGSTVLAETTCGACRLALGAMSTPEVEKHAARAAEAGDRRAAAALWAIALELRRRDVIGAERALSQARASMDEVVKSLAQTMQGA